MKRFLPKSELNPKGFTLVELLVVISIIAILSVIGITIFSSVQINARDARRKGDIDAIAKALEANKVPGSQTYNVLANAQFAGGVIPADSVNGSAAYCANISTTAGADAPAAPTTWVNTSACPTAYTAVSTTYPTSTATSWTVCALLESGSNPSDIYCKSSSQ